MDALIRIGVDLAIALLLIEGAALAVLARRGRGPSLISAIAMTGAGLSLLAALRAALAGGPDWLIALALALGGAAHAVDLARRFRPDR